MKRILTTLTEKWPEYLLEILVLIIGIYGAFSFEEWGENRTKREQEQVILRQLLEDFEANRQQLNEKIAMREVIIQSGQTLLQEFDQPGIFSRDTLYNCLGLISLDPTFDPVNNDLVGSGNIHLIQNSDLTKMLSNWTSDITAVQEIEHNWQKISYEELGPFLIRTGLIRPVLNNYWKASHQNWRLDKNDETYSLIIGESSRKDLKPISEYKEIEGYSTGAISVNFAANKQSKALMIRIDNIIDLLKQEIQ
jgi:hypothetical protein